MITSRQIGGARARSHGKAFEQQIDHLCKRLALEGSALIEKTPEPVRQISAMSRSGTFTAAYTSTAQPDYKGTLKGGRAVVFEAKFCAKPAITFDRVTPEQTAQLREHAELGALSFVFVCFEFLTYYAIPISDWLALPERTGKKSANSRDLAPYQLSHPGDFIADVLAGEACGA